jgi:hypothetical protein
MSDEKKPSYWDQFKPESIKAAVEEKATKGNFVQQQAESLKKKTQAVFMNASEVRQSGGKYLLVDLQVNMLGTSVDAQEVMNRLFADGWSLVAANGSETIVMGSPFTHWHMVFEDTRLK